jgi:hypothetical protein
LRKIFSYLITFVRPFILKNQSKNVSLEQNVCGKTICNDLVKLAQQKSNKIPDMEITDLLLVYYANDEGCWNSDSDKNDGDNDHPIVSISGSTIPSSF